MYDRKNFVRPKMSRMYLFFVLFTSSSSVRMSSVLGALAGDAPRGGVVDGGGVLWMALSGSSCCRPPPATTARSAPRDRTPAHIDGEQVVNACWGLLSGLLSTTSGVLKVPARGWPPVEALALFATLWASVSTFLQR